MNTNNSQLRQGKTDRAFWVCAFVTIANALTSAGFSIAALFSSGDAHVNAMYAVSRSLSLAAVCMVVVSMRSRIGLAILASTMALIQAGDAVIGGIDRSVIKTIGPAFLSVVTLSTLVLLLRSERSSKQ
jgi:hypothetical protein